MRYSIIVKALGANFTLMLTEKSEEVLEALLDFLNNNKRHDIMVRTETGINEKIITLSLKG